MKWLKVLVPLVFLFFAVLYIFLKAKVGIDKEIPAPPLVSMITSLWNADEFIEGFMQDTVNLHRFSETELIIINANSPGNEEPIIKKYMEKYPNIRYVKLEKDPGLYGVWNMAIKMAKAPYIANGNVDDRRYFDLINLQIETLNQHPEVDLVYSGYYLTSMPNQTFEDNTYTQEVNTLLADFSPEAMHICLPGPLPMWRKSMHEKYGYFDESFISAGDWEFWNRAVSQGSVFKKIPGAYGLVYLNPAGLSTDKNEIKTRKRMQENIRIILRYRSMWMGKKNAIQSTLTKSSTL